MKMSSNRVKRLLKRIENLRGSKGKKRRVSGSDAESCKGGAGLWAPKSFGDFPTSNIYNSTSRSPPAELFRKDLISAMKLPDNEPLSLEEYWFISDPWKQEWERGVQVPVNPEALPEPSVRVLRKKDKSADFKLPKKLIRITHDDFFSNDFHHMSTAPTQADQVCRYDLDDCDFHWLRAANKKRQIFGLPKIEESMMEIIMEDLECQCFENMQDTINSEAGLGIEYDEDVICDVCRSPDSEEGNEMVFCDACDICVHQACYGITEIPEGSWLCCTCSLTIKPNCILCPNKGGAMKCTRNGQTWAHVSCALWIPEVSIGCVEKMEPITKISHIPQSRWGLICCLCRERVGACIQCSVKTCKTAYHVTCGFQNGLEMKAVVEDVNDEDGVKLRSYCPKHSKNKDLSPSTDSEEEGDESSTSRICTENTADKANLRAKKLHQIEAGFYKYVKVHEISNRLQVPLEMVEFVYQYWKLKRRSGFNKPLMHPRSGENEALGQEQEDGLYARMKMFVHLRQDLERVRNLCYMVSRREKLSRSWYSMREQIFQKQMSVLTDPSLQLLEPERKSIIHACHGNNIYDRLSAHSVSCCVGGVDPSPNSSSDNLNGNVFKDFCDVERTGKGQRKQKTPSERLPNPYAKTYYFNGVHNRSRRRSSSGGFGMSESQVTKLKESLDNDDGNLSDANGKIEFCDRTESAAVRSCADSSSGESRISCASIGAIDVSGNAKDFLAVTEAEEEDEVVASPSAKLNNTPSLDASYSNSDAEFGISTAIIKNHLCDDNAAKIGEKTVDEVHPVKHRLRNGFTLACLDKRPEEQDSEESPTHFIKDEVGRDSSLKENVERKMTDDIQAARVRVSDKKGDEKADGEIRRHKCRKSKQRPMLKSPTEKQSPKERSKKLSLSFLSDSAPFRDKLRQESAKVHESLFSNTMKGSLAGYRIPKKSRSESESDSVKVENQQNLPSPQPLPQQQQQQPQPVWKESKSPSDHGSSRLPQSPSWNCSNPKSPPPPPASLSTPPPIPPVTNVEKRPTRRDRYSELSSSATHLNGCSPRLVIKLRKDPNYPESPRWRRDGDVQGDNVYDFKCEASESPPKHIRLKLNTKSHRHAYKHPSNHLNPAPVISENRTSEKGSSKYSMRTRANAEDSIVSNVNLSYS